MIYVILILFSFLLTYFIKNYFIKNSLVSNVTERSSHTIPTPHGGGIAIAVTWFLGITYLYFFDNINTTLYFSLLPGIIISIVSYLDDVYELSSKIRLLVQSIVSVLGLYLIGGLSTINLFFYSIESPFLTNFFAFLIIVWFINLFNFLDGIDGYAGSETLFLSFAGYLLFGGEHFIVLGCATIGFLFWNWHKAKIFMGDVGSTLLGYNIAIFTLYYANESSTNLWIWIILFGLFWFDATLTLFRRYRNKEKISLAHKKHAYQRLTQYGWSHNKVVTYSIFINIILFSFVYFITNILIAFLASIILLYLIMQFVDKKRNIE